MKLAVSHNHRCTTIGALLPFLGFCKCPEMATIQSLIDEYAASLEALSGAIFQAEVCARLQTFIIGFQTVPDKPHGDAGLDAFSDHGERAYCCYGPEHDQFKTPKQRETAIVTKFRSDLRRLYEVEFDKKVLRICESPEMASILPKGRRIKEIQLLVNWFESHRILSPILSLAEEYQHASKCRYVSEGADVIVVGPKDLANRYAVDEVTITRARQRIFIQKVKSKAESLVLENTAKFDIKRERLKQIVSGHAEQIDGLWQELQSCWRMALAFEQELSDTLPNLHRDFEANRARILKRVLMLMVGSPEPWAALGQATDVAAGILQPDFGNLYGMLIEDVSSGEIARLIGECPIGWETPVSLA
jgi:hypothetical protein